MPSATNCNFVLTFASVAISSLVSPCSSTGVGLTLKQLFHIKFFWSAGILILQLSSFHHYRVGKFLYLSAQIFPQPNVYLFQN